MSQNRTVVSPPPDASRFPSGEYETWMTACELFRGGGVGAIVDLIKAASPPNCLNSLPKTLNKPGPCTYLCVPGHRVGAADDGPHAEDGQGLVAHGDDALARDAQLLQRLP